MSVSKITGAISTFVKNIKPLDVATKSAGALALLSVINEANMVGVNRACRNSKVFEAKKAVRLRIGEGKLNYESPKYNQIKKFTRDAYPYEIGKAFHGFNGYLEGFAEVVANNVFTAGFSALALASKKKCFKIASLIGLLASIGCNFVKNGTSILEKTDKLE